jgi:hypothetical protein
MPRCCENDEDEEAEAVKDGRSAAKALSIRYLHFPDAVHPDRRVVVAGGKESGTESETNRGRGFPLARHEPLPELA